MSPCAAPIIILILLGLVVSVVGLVCRKKALVVAGLPGLTLLVAWYFLASVPPPAGIELEDIFGSENARYAKDPKTVKPTLMDGFFLSFEMSPEDFEQRIRPQLEPVFLPPKFSGGGFSRGQDLPSGWPAVLVEKSEFLEKPSRSSGTGSVRVYCDSSTRRAYVSVGYASW
jgi:hypothetical protein